MNESSNAVAQPVSGDFSRARPDAGRDNTESIRASLQFRIIDPTKDREWDAIVTAHPLHSIFHTSAWAKVLRSTYGHNPVYLYFSRGDKPAALFPVMEVASCLTGRRGVSLPFADFCDPLFYGELDAPSISTELCAIARERHWKHLEVRGEPKAASDAMLPVTFYGHALSLSSDSQAVRGAFASSIQRSVAKAERSALSVSVSQGSAAIDDFYQLHLRTRLRHGAPPQPMEFFRNIYKHVIAAGLGFVVVAKENARPAAAAVFFKHGHKAVYKFGASDERLLEHRGNNLVMWEAIKSLCAAGVTTLHFGRTSPENAGLRRFKLGWGTKESAIRYWRLNPMTQKWTAALPDSHSFSQDIFRQLPSMVNRWAGALLYPHLD